MNSEDLIKEVKTALKKFGDYYERALQLLIIQNRIINKSQI